MDCKVIAGQKFGRLTVVVRSGSTKWREALWRCRCDCGKETTVKSGSLTSGHTTSCGCWAREKASRLCQARVGVNNPNWKQLESQRFGRLTIIQRAAPRRGEGYWVCLCDCGNKTIVRGSHLGQTIFSCGCLRRDQSRERLQGNTYRRTHNEKGTRLYNIRSGMLQRCYYPPQIRYLRYGGRGITVCSEWRESFEIFRDWALANGYRDDLTIDRIDNDGNYEPGNCRWATYKEQQANRPKSRRIAV